MSICGDYKPDDGCGELVGGDVVGVSRTDTAEGRGIAAVPELSDHRFDDVIRSRRPGRDADAVHTSQPGVLDLLRPLNVMRGHSERIPDFGQPGGVGALATADR